MKKFLVVVGVIVAIFAALVVIGQNEEAKRPLTPTEVAQNLYDARQDPQAVNLKIVTQWPKARAYALENPDDTTPPETIARQLQYICDGMNSTVCIIHVWKSEADTPRSQPFTDREDETRYLSYTRNLNTGFEELLLNDGEEVSIPRSDTPSVRCKPSQRC